MLKIRETEPQKDAPALIAALSYLEEEPEKAQEIGLAGARLIEEALTVDSVQRYSLKLK